MALARIGQLVPEIPNQRLHDDHSAGVSEGDHSALERFGDAVAFRSAKTLG